METGSDGRESLRRPPVHPPFRTDSGHLSLSAIQMLRTAGELVG